MCEVPKWVGLIWRRWLETFKPFAMVKQVFAMEKQLFAKSKTDELSHTGES